MSVLQTRAPEGSPRKDPRKEVPYDRNESRVKVVARAGRGDTVCFSLIFLVLDLKHTVARLGEKQNRGKDEKVKLQANCCTLSLQHKTYSMD